MTLHPLQQQAVDLATAKDAPRVVCLCGGPGTGKTYTVRAMCEELQAQRRTVQLCAPSGNAAKRLAESTGREASTIHRMLGSAAFAHGDSEQSWDEAQLTADVVICDEASMVDVRLMATLMRACFEAGGGVQTLVLVGDPDQLPPVGPGSPYLDLVESGACATVRLTQPHRQALDSGVIRAAYAIQRGDVPEWCEDFTLRECEDAAAIAEVCADLVSEGYQVISPQRTRAGGCEEINELVDAQQCSGLRVRGLREGSKVIHTKNNYMLGGGVFNGDTGTVDSVYAWDQSDPPKPHRKDLVCVNFDDGRHVMYRGSPINELQLAWALTIHKSQGSEWPRVAVVCHTSHAFMLSRSLLYVAATRARERVVVVGTEAAVAKAVRNVRPLSRSTHLGRWLREEVTA